MLEVCCRLWVAACQMSVLIAGAYLMVVESLNSKHDVRFGYEVTTGLCSKPTRPPGWMQCGYNNRTCPLLDAVH